MNVRSFVRLGLTLVAAAIAGSVWSQQSAPRVALIIGNARYPEAGTPLPTAINDALRSPTSFAAAISMSISRRT